MSPTEERMQRQVKLEISGMNCGHCVAAVRKALEWLDDVVIQSVSIGEARVAYAPDSISAEQITRAVTEAGFPATVAGNGQ
jgi:copper chaperone CopZ